MGCYFLHSQEEYGNYIIYWVVSMCIKLSNFSKLMRLLWFHHPHQRPVWSKVSHSFDTCWYQIITCWVKAPVLPVCYHIIYASISAALKLSDLLIWISDPPRLQHLCVREVQGGDTTPPFLLLIQNLLQLESLPAFVSSGSVLNRLVSFN